MKKHLLLLTLTLTCLSVSNSSYAYTSYGLSCGAVLSSDKDGSFALKHALPAWLMGYITGRNYELDRDMSDNPDGDSLYYAALKYCRDNPLKSLARGAKDIYSTLK